MVVIGISSTIKSAINNVIINSFYINAFTYQIGFAFYLIKLHLTYLYKSLKDKYNFLF